MNDYDFGPAVIGSTAEGNLVLNFDSMVDVLMSSGDFEDLSEAQEYIDWNASFGNSTVKNPSIILYPKYDEETGSEYAKEHGNEDSLTIDYVDSAFVGTTHGGAFCYDLSLAISIVKAKLKCDEATASRIIHDIIIPMSKNTSLNEPIFILKSLDK